MRREQVREMNGAEIRPELRQQAGEQSSIKQSRQAAAVQ